MIPLTIVEYMLGKNEVWEFKNQFCSLIVARLVSKTVVEEDVVYAYEVRMNGKAYKKGVCSKSALLTKSVSEEVPGKKKRENSLFFFDSVQVLDKKPVISFDLISKEVNNDNK